MCAIKRPILVLNLEHRSNVGLSATLIVVMYELDSQKTCPSLCIFRRLSIGFYSRKQALHTIVSIAAACGHELLACVRRLR